VGVQMRWIPPGSFLMGSPETEDGRWDDEGPITEVALTSGFWLGTFPVTQGEFEAITGERPSKFTSCPDVSSFEHRAEWAGAVLAGSEWSRLPVERVSWYDAMRFCQALTERERRCLRLPVGFEYALPTEAQWEYACRAGGTGMHPRDVAEVAWNEQGATAKQTYPVGLKDSNGFGLHDMLGNVSEWCADWFDERHHGGAVIDPRGPTSGTNRVLRGGGWNSANGFCRYASRSGVAPGGRHASIGFRLALGESRPPVVSQEAGDWTGELV
jgi:formylglycine-generating enzyme required for sulfatase activity